jgi:hypothetical protein
MKMGEFAVGMICQERGQYGGLILIDEIRENTLTGRTVHFDTERWVDEEGDGDEREQIPFDELALSYGSRTTYRPQQFSHYVGTAADVLRDRKELISERRQREVTRQTHTAYLTRAREVLSEAGIGGTLRGISGTERLCFDADAVSKLLARLNLEV